MVSEVITLREAVELTGRSRQSLLMRTRRGKLWSTKNNEGLVLVRRADVLDLPPIEPDEDEDQDDAEAAPPAPTAELAPVVAVLERQLDQAWSVARDSEERAKAAEERARSAETRAQTAEIALVRAEARAEVIEAENARLKDEKTRGLERGRVIREERDALAAENADLRAQLPPVPVEKPGMLRRVRQFLKGRNR